MVYSAAGASQMAWMAGEWTAGCQEWFELAIYQHLRWVHDHKKETQWLSAEDREALEGDELRTAVARWFADRAQDYTAVYAYDQYDADTERAWYWELDWTKINRTLPGVLDTCEMADLTVDEWLDWLKPYSTYKGELQVDAGPKEPCMSPDLKNSARARRVSWPRRCSVCDTMFRPSRRTQARCPRHRKTFGKAKCPGCTKSFTKDHHSAKFCPSCRARRKGNPA